MNDEVFFENKPIRRKKIEGNWHYVIKDAVIAVGGVEDTKSCIKSIRKQDPEVRERWNELVQRPEVSTKRSPQHVNAASKENLKFIIRSKKSWPLQKFFTWLDKID